MSFIRKVLNLPEKDREGGDTLAEAIESRAAGAPERPAAPDRPPSSASWSEVKEGAGTSAVRKGGRLLLWGVVALAAVTGVKAWVSPAKSPPPPAAAPDGHREEVPVQEAQRVAARFARSYLTWSSSAPKVRETELASDLAKGLDLKMGWNGQGFQQVAQSIPGRVEQLGGNRARVLVDVRVSYTTGQGANQQTVADWRSLQIPVASVGDRVVVTGQPALVGDPVPVPGPSASIPEPDLALSSSTRETVKGFLAAWAAGTESQATAPGASIAPLGGGAGLQALDAWSVDPGDGDRRTGTATVRWRIAGAELQQTYRITLAKVSAAEATRWQVWQVTSL
ncbi:conjugal transfer protein [Kitasatospora sp. NPDC088783]|uniref:conjugal transfer protein n=1 Tax=Kitasatospora sp. NPDC088783 TaxID=3364077 RepID=UPI00382C12F3